MKQGAGRAGIRKIKEGVEIWREASVRWNEPSDARLLIAAGFARVGVGRLIALSGLLKSCTSHPGGSVLSVYVLPANVVRR